MARAELALIIEEAGPAPVGEPAPESVRSDRHTAGGSRPRGSSAESTARGADAGPSRETLDRFHDDTLRFHASVGDFVKAVAHLSATEGRPDRPAPERTGEPSGSAARTPHGGQGPTDDAGGIMGTFAELARTVGVLGLLGAIHRLIKGFGDLFSATEAVSQAKSREAESTITITQLRTRTAGARPGDPETPEEPRPRLETRSLSRYVGPHSALPPDDYSATTKGGAGEAMKERMSWGRMAAGAAVATAGVVALGFAAKKAGDALDDQARKLSQYSPDLARSTAQADIRALRSEIDRAKAVGPGLSRFQDDWSRMMSTFANMGTNIIELLTDLYQLFRPFVKIVESILDVIAAALEVLVDAVKIIVDILTGSWIDAWEGVQEMGRDIKKWVEKIASNFGSDDPLADDFADQLLASVGLGVNPPPTPPGGGGGAPPPRGPRVPPGAAGGFF